MIAILVGGWKSKSDIFSFPWQTWAKEVVILKYWKDMCLKIKSYFTCMQKPWQSAYVRVLLCTTKSGPSRIGLRSELQNKKTTLSIESWLFNLKWLSTIPWRSVGLNAKSLRNIHETDSI